VDLIELERIADALHHGGERFVARFCTDDERRRAQGLGDTRYFSTLFVVKEAVLKALGTGVTRWVGWHDIDVSITPAATEIELRRGARRRLVKLGGAKVRCSTNVSKAYAQAFVILEEATRPNPPAQKKFGTP
jgi:holo-[acyl-carrier protein] synthase